MEITFRVFYKTHFGQIPVVSGNIPQLGNLEPEKATEMVLIDVNSGQWELKIKLPASVKSLEYRYYIKDNNYNTFIQEWGQNRVIELDGKGMLVADSWRSNSDPRYALFSKAIGQTILHNPSQYTSVDEKSPDGLSIRFSLALTRIKPEHRLGIVGNIPELGNWDTTKARLLGNTKHPTWEGTIRVKSKVNEFEYKYCIIDSQNNKLIHLEAGENRKVKIAGLSEESHSIVINDEHFEFPVQPWKCAGVAIPVFSLRRKNGCGVGEFSDLRLLVDWAKLVGMKIIQILPVNDTVATHTWIDSYPYSGISVYALHPIYVDISKIGKLKSPITQQIIEEQSQYLNSLNKIDYEAVMKLKSRFFKEIYDEQQRAFLKEPDYQKFYNENKEWLQPYAAFSYLRDLFNTPDFTRWGKYSKCTPEIIAELCDPKADHFDDIAIHYYIQYHAHKQLLDAAEYARKNGVAIKGDIPIGIYRNSVDAWVAPQLYHMDCQAGAPPDDFSISGQNWRFPTYNWDEMSKDNYQWWQQRLKKMADYFDAFRIDHILGFFRIWEIPGDQVEGLMGRFNPSLPFSREEIVERGMWFDYERLCKPYIREHFLYDFFREYTLEVREEYLESYAPGCYQLKEQYNTQKKIEAALSLPPDAPREVRVKNETIKLGLFGLISQVIFLEAPNGQGKWFVPRHSMHFTKSYQELDHESKYRLNELYIEYFYRRNEQFWAANAMKKLPTIKNATNMLLCGEDLGMVPKCVPEVMNHLGILSLEIQRMPKQQDIEFTHPNNYPYLSVATPSSHDTSTIRGWWEEDPARSQRFFNNILGNWGNSPFYCETWIVRQIIEQHLHCPSMLTIFPIQDLLGMSDKLRYPDAREERINQPANPTHYWRYRMHIALEDLILETEFNNFLREMIQKSGRASIY
ncbi:MAG TPA: 4-alpha-glucanotransferase [Salinivirgaceae bacterium]|nr:4-alpha-glucanotransferase [Salinivirgaceae bacterium]